MNTYRMTLLPLIAGFLLLIGMAVIPSVSVGEDPPPPFTPTEYHGLLDTETGLVWGRDIGVQDGQLFPQMFIDMFYNTVDLEAEPQLPLFREFSGDFHDWRPPTISEVMTAIDHGLLDYIDFSYFQEGRQDANSVMDAYVGDPDGTTYAEAWFWTICTQRWKGLHNRGKVKFGNGADIPFESKYQSGAGWAIAVRGMPEDHTNCPGKHGQEENKPDKPGKPRK